ncbi:uncharacterized protein LOC105179144 [Sesamum indicum]|uniref:Uncharacterized protein LOC105179144 n=1 Tax=Sesamum indicum TaxID=4182 RepID=A0A6I9UKR4_SESIN|nr:uncharacterized protein LOC105179144 [Sesamum indicum]
MGNCIETCCKNSPEGEMMMNQQQEEENPKNGSMMRVKVVLTKEELEWLMSQLKNTEETRRLEDVLGDIKRSREKISSTTVAWKPSLDSIVESPEVPEGMDRS